MAGKVSVIMPAFNCSKFIGRAIDSVRTQSYYDWELIIINDCSTDDTFKIMQEYASEDERIIIHSNKKNCGAAETRNRAIKIATGKYLAFLDSDDLWYPEKLKKQIGFMEKNGYSFSCTSYNKIDELDNDLGIVIKALNVDYNGLLKRCPGNSTVIYNVDKLGKHYIPNIRKRNDYVMWLQVIKNSKKLLGVDDVLSSHRIGIKSISSNKKSLVKYHWIVYRDIEKLSLLKSIWLIIFWICKSIFRFQ